MTRIMGHFDEDELVQLTMRSLEAAGTPAVPGRSPAENGHDLAKSNQSKHKWRSPVRDQQRVQQEQSVREVGRCEGVDGAVVGSDNRADVPAPLHKAEKSTQATETKKKARSKRVVHEEYVSDEELQRGVASGKYFKGTFRPAAGKKEAYVTVPGLECDVLLYGDASWNRAIAGDVVAVQLLPCSQWYTLHSRSPANAQAATAAASSSGSPSRPVQQGLAAADEAADAQLKASSPAAALEVVRRVLEARHDLRPTATVVAIVERSLRRQHVVGVLSEQEGQLVLLIPNDGQLPRMVVAMNKLPAELKADFRAQQQAPAGQPKNLVKGRLLGWDAGNLFPLVEVTGRLGVAGDIEAETAGFLETHAVRSDAFSDAVLACLPPTPWSIAPEDEAQRRDLRELRVFTIDPTTAKDLDDALSVQELPSGLVRVGVHIADVSHFVERGSALDEEAALRSTSVYLLQRVVPMLPPLLCEQLCSLNPGVDRLAFSVMWDMDEQARIHSFWLGRTIIASCAKLAYEQVQAVLDAADGSVAAPLLPEVLGGHEWEGVARDACALRRMARALRERRVASGSVRLSNVKLSFRRDDDGMPLEAAPNLQTEAHQLVEEMMLLANHTVAGFTASAFPELAVLRQHPPPKPDAMAALSANLAARGVQLDGSSSGALQACLERLAAEREPHLVEIVTQLCIKPMQLAMYISSAAQPQADSWRHWALAMPVYTHFTSPIRRYPDVLVHRIAAAAIDHFGSQHELRAPFAPYTPLPGGRWRPQPLRPLPNAPPLLQLVRQRGLHSLDALQAQLKICNERKVAAKAVQGRSAQLHLCVLLRRRPVLTDAFVAEAYGSKFFSLFVPAYGCLLVVHVNQIVPAVQAVWDGSSNTLQLQPVPEDAAWASADAQTQRVCRGVAIEPSKVAAATALPLPCSLQTFARVPVLLFAELSNSGCPSTLSVRLLLRSAL